MMKITKKKKTKKIIKNYNSIFVDDYIYIYTHTQDIKWFLLLVMTIISYKYIYIYTQTHIIICYIFLQYIIFVPN